MSEENKESSQEYDLEKFGARLANAIGQKSEGVEQLPAQVYDLVAVEMSAARRRIDEFMKVVDKLVLGESEGSLTLEQQMEKGKFWKTVYDHRVLGTDPITTSWEKLKRDGRYF